MAKAGISQNKFIKKICKLKKNIKQIPHSFTTLTKGCENLLHPFTWLAALYAKFVTNPARKVLGPSVQIIGSKIPWTGQSNLESYQLRPHLWFGHLELVVQRPQSGFWSEMLRFQKSPRLWHRTNKSFCSRILTAEPVKRCTSIFTIRHSSHHETQVSNQRN